MADPRLALAILTLALAHAAAPAGEKQLRSDLKGRRNGDFAPLLSRWEKAYGTSAVHPLLKIAADRSLADNERYVALMAAARLGGAGTSGSIVPFLKDRSWMLRSAALRALGAIGASADSKAVLALLKDPALVVRTEAIETILRLKPEGSVEALLETLEAPENYHGGKAQWVPQHALEALIQLKAPPTIAPRLAPLLRREHQGDQSLQQSVLAALEALTGKRLKHGASLSARVEAWSRELRGEAPSPSSAHR